MTNVFYEFQEIQTFGVSAFTYLTFLYNIIQVSSIHNLLYFYTTLLIKVVYTVIYFVYIIHIWEPELKDNLCRYQIWAYVILGWFSKCQFSPKMRTSSGIEMGDLTWDLIYLGQWHTQQKKWLLLHKKRYFMTLVCGKLYMVSSIPMYNMWHLL